MSSPAPAAPQTPAAVTKPLISADDVKMHFPLRGGLLRSVKGHVMAVDGVSLRVRKGETLAVVGESGCGKSTLARVLIRLLDPSAGKVYFMGRDLTTAKLRTIRGERRHIQMVFQDPMSSLDPRMTIKNIIAEPLVIHEERRLRSRSLSALALLAVAGGLLSIALGAYQLLLAGMLGYTGLSFLTAINGIAALVLIGYGVLEVAGGDGVWQMKTWGWWLLLGLGVANAVSWAFLDYLVGVGAAALLILYLVLVRKQFRSGEELTARVLELLELVGLKKEHLNRFPHEFSGGQRQRINIARALALNPDAIILDEPTSALDVSVQAQILNLLMGLQARLGLTYLFITHDLSVVYHIADRVAVMYAGKIVEVGPTEDIFLNPLHPYTKALISAAPVADPSVTVNRIVLEGEVPSPIHPPTGCRFHPRCWLAFQPCDKQEPPLFQASPGRTVACFATARDLGLWPPKKTPAPEVRVEAR